MYNTDLPRRADLPSSARLVRSTILAAASAAAILVIAVLPADYGIDPTGVGRLLGLTDMGQTKVRLAAEAEAERVGSAQSATQVADSVPAAGDTELAGRIAALERTIKELVQVTAASRSDSGTLTAEDQIAAAAEAASIPETEQPTVTNEVPAQDEATAAAVAPVEPEVKSDTISVTLTPGEGVEIKLVMKKGAQANFAWVTEGGPVNFDIHGDGPGGQSISYEKGRGVQAADGTLTAGFDGNHGWFWRNRGEENVQLTLQTKGYYSELKRMN